MSDGEVTHGWPKSFRQLVVTKQFGKPASLIGEFLERNDNDAGDFGHETQFTLSQSRNLAGVVSSLILVMGNDVGPVVFMGFAAFVVIVIAIVAMISSNKRRKALQEFAAAQGLVYFDGTFRVESGLFFQGDWLPGPSGWFEGLDAYSPFGQGHSRRVSNLMLGEKSGLRWAMFDYVYVTGSGKHQTTHTYGILLSWIPYRLPRLSISPENFLTRIGNSIGFADIQFESEEFNRKFRVTCNDRKAAFDVIHPLMIEFLMQCPMWGWQFGYGEGLIVNSSIFSPTEYYRAMEDMANFVERLPDYFKEDTKL